MFQRLKERLYAGGYLIRYLPSATRPREMDSILLISRSSATALALLLPSSLLRTAFDLEGMPLTDGTTQPIIGTDILPPLRKFELRFLYIF